MNDIRLKIMQTIAKLRARADNAGASEAEAMTCAQKAAEMMEAYEIEEADLLVAEGMGEITFDIVEKTTAGHRGNGAYQHRANTCLHNIKVLCGVEIVIHHRRRGRTVGFIGHNPDVEFAMFLYDTIKAAMDTGYERWKRDQPQGVHRTAKGSFQMAMGSRLNARLQELRQGRVERRAHQSRALVLVDVKKEKVRAEYKARYPKLGRAKSFTFSRHATAYHAGQDAGNHVGLGRPIGGESCSRLTA